MQCKADDELLDAAAHDGSLDMYVLPLVLVSHTELKLTISSSKWPALVEQVLKRLEHVSFLHSSVWLD